MMIGDFIKNRKGELTINSRTSVGWGQYKGYAEIMYLAESKVMYLIGDAMYSPPWFFRVGLETEDRLPMRSGTDWGFGPKVVLPFGNSFVWMVVYQFHSADKNQIWLRTIISF